MTPRDEKEPIGEVRWQDATAVVDVRRDVDLYSTPQFQQLLSDLLDRRPRRVLVNLGEVGYMDSSGVASLVKALSQAKEVGAELRLFGLSDRVRGIFEITRLDTVFDIYDSEGEARS